MGFPEQERATRNGDQPPPLRVFCSYAHSDYETQHILSEHMASLVLLGIVEPWDDRKIEPGEEGDRLINDELNAADVVLCVVSHHFMASNYIQRRELPLARDRARAGKCKLIAIVATSVYGAAKLFDERQLMPKDEANNLTPLDEWEHPNRAFKRIGEHLARLHERRMSETAASEKEPPRWAKEHRSETFVGRERLLKRLGRDFANAGPAPIIVLEGGSGVGKTSVAAEYCWTHRADYDHIVWLSTEQDTRLETEFVNAAELIAGLPSSDQEAARLAFRDWLGENGRWLLVFDNAVDPGAVLDLLPPRFAGDVLVTTREDVWRGHARVVPVDALSHEDAVELLMEATRSSDTAAADDIAKALDHNPRAIMSAVHLMRTEGVGLAEYAERKTAALQSMR